MEGEAPLESFPVAQKPANNLFSRVAKFVKRFWYVPVAVLIIISVLTLIVVRKSHTDQSWKKATDYYGRADYEKAAKALAGLSVPSDAQRLTVYSQTMLATHQLDKALLGYQRLYDIKKDPGVKLIIGNIYNEKKDYEKAEKIYNEAITANPSYVQAYVNLATLYKMQGKNDQAVATAQKGVEANPRSATLYELLVSMLLDKKDSPEYKKAVATLAEINPQDPLLESLKQ